MITQILGVALISLLTITPTIQQNNIEQLIVPNIEITQNNLINIDNSRLQIVNQFAIANANSDTVMINFNDIGNRLYDLSPLWNFESNAYIVNNNFYYHTIEWVNGNRIRSQLQDYYLKTRGSSPTSSTFSFTQTTDFVTNTTTFYTYTLNGVQGQINGRIYIKNENDINTNNASLFRNNVTLEAGTNITALINQLIPTENLEQSNSSTSNNLILYRWLSSSINFNQVGTYTRTLYGRTNYGTYVTYGTFTLNLIQPTDTTAPVITGPTSLTFEVGTYSLIEQILNNLYTFTDNVAIEDAYYFPVTSINTVGTFNITVYATDAAGNRTELPVTITTTPPPPQDTTPPVIVGSDTITRNLGQVNNDSQLANQFNVTDDFTQESAIVKTISGTRSYTEAGTYNLTLTATDIAGNVATKQFTFIINPPVIDNEPPVIDSDLIVSITIGDFTDRQEILDFYTTVTDNVALSSVLLVGDIDFNVVGDYQLQIIATDTSQNQATRNILIRIKDEVILGNYNPLTDLLSGIFGASLSMIFTIGTINVLGLRLLDAMGVIILGAVLLFVYKAIKGGS